jgi:CO dehydrogenase/acetyl-CoA synthase epsilon subunit
MSQQHFARKKRQLIHAVEELDHLLSLPEEAPMSLIEKLLARIRKLVNELMHVLSQFELKRILGGLAALVGISFAQEVSGQSFAEPQVNPFGLHVSSYFTLPAFADLDGDGDQDLMVGTFSGTFNYYKNIGSATEPHFTVVQRNPFGLIKLDYYAAPAFADLDGDGDLDLLSGNYGGVLIYFENTGSGTSPHFDFPRESPFGLTGPGNSYLSMPVFADMDADGDSDLLMGGAFPDYIGRLMYCENTGEPEYPQFAAYQEGMFGLGSTYMLSAPAVADVDGDGDFDLLVSEYYGNSQYFENTGTASFPQFANPADNPFEFDLGYTYFAFPTFADLDGDGDPDLMVAVIGGDLYYFENTSATGLERVGDGPSIRIYPNPTSDFIRLESSEQIQQVEVLDMHGSQLMMHQFVDELNLSDLYPGVYILKIVLPDGSQILRKVIRK